jgi:hypothetical protein
MRPRDASLSATAFFSTLKSKQLVRVKRARNIATRNFYQHHGQLGPSWISTESRARIARTRVNLK